MEIPIENKPRNNRRDIILDWVAANKKKSLALAIAAFYFLLYFVIIVIYMAKR